ncbi:MAG: hypothetical protein D6781_11505 [Verrucomicrobia bacterium]|nr:MAG: hypothetical protein D6781_11505 [Verrucomicrobiota bacterium]
MPRRHGRRGRDPRREAPRRAPAEPPCRRLAPPHRRHRPKWRCRQPARGRRRPALQPRRAGE